MDMETLHIIATVLASIAMVLIIAGLIYARNRKKHVPLMMAAFVCDMIGLVLVEFGPFIFGETDAISSLAKDPGPMKTIHATLATIAVICYIIQIVSGKKILAGDRTKLVGHKKVATIFLLTRFAAYITMFML